MVLGGQLPGRVDGRRNPIRKVESQKRFYFLSEKVQKHKKRNPFSTQRISFFMGIFYFAVIFLATWTPLAEA